MRPRAPLKDNVQNKKQSGGCWTCWGRGGCGWGGGLTAVNWRHTCHWPQQQTLDYCWIGQFDADMELFIHSNRWSKAIVKLIFHRELPQASFWLFCYCVESRLCVWLSSTPLAVCPLSWKCGLESFRKEQLSMLCSEWLSKVSSRLYVWL